MALPKRDTQHHTYGEYLTWSDDQRVELIDGAAYVKEPAPGSIHQEVAGALYRQICAALEGTSSWAYIAPFDVRLPSSDETDEKIETVLQPDVLVVRDDYRVDRRGLRGAPDWLAEVLSPSTARHDLVHKIPVYERACVAEVWLIYPTDRKVTIYRLKDGRYERPTIVEMKGRTPLITLPGVSIDWGPLLARLARSAG